MITDLPTPLRTRLRSVSAGSAADVRLVLADGTQVRWGGPVDSARKAAVLLALLPQHARVIDVSAPEPHDPRHPLTAALPGAVETSATPWWSSVSSPASDSWCAFTWTHGWVRPRAASWLLQISAAGDPERKPAGLVGVWRTGDPAAEAGGRGSACLGRGPCPRFHRAGRILFYL